MAEKAVFAYRMRKTTEVLLSKDLVQRVTELGVKAILDAARCVKVLTYQLLKVALKLNDK